MWGLAIQSVVASVWVFALWLVCVWAHLWANASGGGPKGKDMGGWQMNTGSPGNGSALSGPGSALYLCSHWAGCAYATLQRAPRLKIVGSVRSCEHFVV